MLTLVLLFAVLLPLFIITIFIPYWTRRTESFGVSIPEEMYHTTQLQNMRKQYAMYAMILSVLATATFIISGFFLSHNEETLSIFLGVLTFVYIIASFFIYLKFHRNMKELKEKEQWSEKKSQQVFIDTKFREQKVTYSNLWFLAPVVIAIILIVMSFQAYPAIPDKIPTKFSFSGEVTNWTEKSYKSILLNPVMMIYFTLLFIFINFMIAKAKQQISVNQPTESIQKNIIFRRRWSLFLITTSYLLSFLFTMIQLSLMYPINGEIQAIISLITTAIILIHCIVLSITTGQGGSRVKTVQSQSQDIIDRDDDKYWKLGQFYFNKNDPALFLEKRFGVGWTINIARPLAWIIFLVIIGLAILIPMILS